MKKEETCILTSVFCPKPKHAQVTIFIIVGVLIVSIIVLFFLLRSDIILDGGDGHETNPDIFLEYCMEDKIKKTVETISAPGGYVNPTFYKRFKFEGEDYRDIFYLCYNQNYYLPCINQEPMLIQHLKDEIKEEIKFEVEDCFTELGKSLDKQGYTVDATYRGFKVELMPKKIVVEINANMTLTKTEESLRYENFTIIVASRFYDLAIVVQEIVSQEARFCNFELLGFMLLYPEFNIDKFRTSDSTIIYTIKHGKEKFRFAIRGCVV